MIKFDSQTKDALIEICNVGMSKSAKQLSMLLDSRINITIPAINVDEASKINEYIAFPSDHLLSYVYQTISSDLSGRAILIIQKEYTSLLTESIISRSPKLTEKEIRACEQEAMLEVGNIMITCCISAIVNMLKCKAELSVPAYSENNFTTIIENQLKEVKTVSDNVIIMETKLDAAGSNITGELILILTEDSVEHLLDSLKKLLNVI